LYCRPSRLIPKPHPLPVFAGRPCRYRCFPHWLPPQISIFYVSSAIDLPPPVTPLITCFFCGEFPSRDPIALSAGGTSFSFPPTTWLTWPRNGCSLQVFFLRTHLSAPPCVLGSRFFPARIFFLIVPEHSGFDFRFVSLSVLHRAAHAPFAQSSHVCQTVPLLWALLDRMAPKRPGPLGSRRLGSFFPLVAKRERLFLLDWSFFLVPLSH